MIQDCLKEKALEAFIPLFEKKKSILIEELWSSPKALLIALLLKNYKKNVLVIGHSLSSKIQDDLNFFNVEALELPSWETLPGEEIPPSSDIVGKRYEVLKALGTKAPKVIFTTLQGALQKVFNQQKLNACCEKFTIGQNIPFKELSQKLESLGYKRCTVVTEKGDYALRGGICDIFPLSSIAPIRIDFFGDEIDSMRYFDPVSQKSIEKITEFLLTPASEADLLEKEERLSLIFDYMEKDSIIVFDELEPIEEQYIRIKNLPGSHSKAFATFEELLKKTLEHTTAFFTEKSIFALSQETKAKTSRNISQELDFEWCAKKFTATRFAHPFIPINIAFSSIETPEATTGILQGLEDFCREDGKAFFLYSTEAQLHTLEEKISPFKFPKGTLKYEKGYLSKGFAIRGSKTAIVPFTEFSNRPQIRRQQWRVSAHTPASEFHELHPGDVVVHFNHGVAKFKGIEKKPNHQGVLIEYLVLEYAEKSILYVPISQAHLVSRYIGASEEVPSFSVLGTNKWQKTKMQAQASIVGYAEQLLRMNAERSLKGGFSFFEDSELMRQFEEDFPFHPTEDQKKAIEEIKIDMMSNKAMDRLICGDVGYGKTEVAMRAAFKAVIDGKKQVAVLVPTTVLALQHFESFKERMANFKVNIACLSRFLTLKEAKKIIQDTQDGKVDILIGTHRLLSQDVFFKDLGLIIIDEEQRFGVRAKEKLKTFKTGVDCLTLSATPIPRTLYMTIVGAKDISVINTPPQDRLPIKTILIEHDDELIKNALLRELSREGQAFFIHNRVESIYKIKEAIERLIPGLKAEISHGQMPADQIDAVFHAFKNKEIDLLIATSIVENGIDVPNANTILIDRADQFGLADLYQLRGRVGRWNRPAYAYFLTTKGKALPEIAQRRLNALVATSGFGGGLKLAMRDLEIRGAGDILGVQQSGHVSQVGFHLYCKMLKRTIDALSKQKAPSFIETKIEYSFNASLPEEYVNETSLRMELYHRLGEAMSEKEVDDIFEEVVDRFGKLPEEALWLYHLTRLRVYASSHGYTLIKIEKMTFSAERQNGKQVVKKLLPMPKYSGPKSFEAEVIKALKAAF